MTAYASRKQMLDREKNMMKQLTRKIAISAALAALFAAPACAEDVKAGDLVITQALSRATPSRRQGRRRLPDRQNKGAAADRLLGGSGDVAGRVEIHEMAMDNGVMKMRPLDKGLDIAPGKTVKLAPGGYHLMLMDLKTPVQAGRQGAGDAAVRKGRQGARSRSMCKASARRLRGGDHRRPHDEEVAAMAAVSSGC